MANMDWDIVEQGVAMRRMAWDMVARIRWLELDHADDEGINGLMGRELELAQSRQSDQLKTCFKKFVP